MGSFLAFLKILPEFMDLCSQAMSLIVRFVDWAKRNEVRKWLDSLENEMDLLEKAQTPDEKIKSARAIAGILRTLG